MKKIRFNCFSWSVGEDKDWWWEMPRGLGGRFEVFSFDNNDDNESSNGNMNIRMMSIFQDIMNSYDKNDDRY